MMGMGGLGGALLAVQVVTQGVQQFQNQQRAVRDTMAQTARAAQDLAHANDAAFKAVAISATAAAAAVTAAGAAIGYAAVQIGSAVLGIGGEFQQSQQQTRAAIGATAQEMQDLGDTIRDVASNATVAFDEITDSAGGFIRAGGSLETVGEGGLQAIVNMADALVGEGSLQSSILSVVGGINLFGLEMKDADRIANAFAATAVTSAADINSVNLAFSQFAPTAASLGLTVEQTGALVSSLGQSMILGGRAGTALKVMFMQLQGPSKKAKELMEQYGISLYDVNGQLVSLPTIMQRLRDTLGDVNNDLNKLTDRERGAILTTIFGTDGGRAAQIIARMTAEEYSKLLDVFARTDVADMAEVARNAFIPQMQIMQNVITGLTTVVTERFMPALTRAATMVNFFLRQINPQILRDFGDALAALATGKSLDLGFADDLGQVGVYIDRALASIFALRDAVLGQLIPSFISFGRVLFGTRDAVNGNNQAFGTLTTGILTVIRYVSGFLYYAGAFIEAFRQSDSAVRVLSAVIQGVLILALANVVLYTARVALAIPLMAVQFAITVAQFVVGTIVMVANFAIIAASAIGTAAIWVGAWIVAAAPFIALVALVAVGVVVIAATLLAIGSAAVTMYGIWRQSFDLAVQKAVEAFNSIVSVLSTVITALFGFIGDWGKGFNESTGIVDSAVEMVQNALETLPAIFTWLGQTATTIWNAMWKFIADNAVLAWNAIIGLFNQAVPVIILVFSSLFGGLISIATAGFNFVGQTVSKALIGVGELFATIGRGILATWRSAWEGVGGIAAKALNWVIGKINEFIGALKGIPIIGQLISGVGGLISEAGPALGGIGNIVGEVTKAWTDLSGVANNFIEDMSSGFDDIGKMLDGDILNLDEFTRKFEEHERNMRNQRHREGLYADEIAARKRAAMEGELGGGDPYPESADAGGGGAGKKPKGAGKGGSGGGAGGAPSAKEALEALQDVIREITADIPGMTDELVEFLAKLETANPGRLAGMIAALEQSRDIIGDMLRTQLDILETTIELTGVEQRIAALESQRAVVEAQRAVAMIKYQRQLLALRQQILAVDAQILPYRNQISLIERQIGALQRENFVATAARARLEAEALPIRHKILDVERAINEVTDQRLRLTRREAEIRQQLAVNELEAQMRSVSKQLETAWEKMDVPTILRLEEEKAALEEREATAQDHLQLVQDEAEKQSLLDELKTIGLEREKLALEDTLEPYERKIEILDRERELQEAINAIAIAALNGQKQALEIMLEPLLAIREQLDYQVSVVENQRDIEEAQYQERMLYYDEQLAQEKLRQAALKETLRQQNEVFTELIAQFIDGLAASGAFTVSEAAEVAKRMGMWNDQIAKIAEISGAFRHATEEVAALSGAIAAIPKDVTVNINVVTTETTKASGGGGGGGGIDSYATGGVVPGPRGKPRLVIAHGGEYFLGMQHSRPVQAMRAQTQNIHHGSTVSNISGDTNIHLHQAPVARGTERQALRFAMHEIVQMSRK